MRNLVSFGTMSMLEKVYRWTLSYVGGSRLVGSSISSDSSLHFLQYRFSQFNLVLFQPLVNSRRRHSPVCFSRLKSSCPQGMGFPMQS